MPWPLIALAAGGALLGGLAGKKAADASKKPTITKTTVGAPPAELGGYGRINDALNRARDYQPYRVGQGNPYMSQMMGHVMGRAGMQVPEGGYPNPYLQQMQQQAQGQGQQQPMMQLPPEIIEAIRQRLMEQFQPKGQPLSGGGM